MEPKEDERSLEELREDMWWDDEGLARDPDDEDDED